MRRAVAVLLALAAVTVACGDDDRVDGAVPAPGSSTTAPGPGVVAGAPVAGAPGEGDAGTPSPGSTVGPSPGPGSAAPPTPPPQDEGPATTVASPPVADDAHLGPPGSFAGVLLRPQPAQELFLEVLVQGGARPSAGALDRLAAELGRVSGKPVTTTSGVVEGDRASWSAADVRAAADASAGMPQGEGGAVIRLLYLRGRSSDAEGALGVAVRGDVAAVFVDEVRRSSTPLIGTDAIERAVSLHEVGHLLGLVDLFLQTGRADPEHPGHSPSDESVMYWAVETGLFADLGGDLPQDFDAADLADLAAIRRG